MCYLQTKSKFWKGHVQNNFKQILFFHLFVAEFVQIVSTTHKNLKTNVQML